LKLAQDDNWFLIAENNELARIFDHMKSSPINFVQKPSTTNKPLDIFDLATNDASLNGDPCAKYLIEPTVGRYRGGQVLHRQISFARPSGSMVKHGLILALRPVQIA
jgi:hypothetical protein